MLSEWLLLTALPPCFWSIGKYPLRGEDGSVNAMKIVADQMGIDIYEVNNAAANKPFGFVLTILVRVWAAIVYRSTPSI